MSQTIGNIVSNSDNQSAILQILHNSLPTEFTPFSSRGLYAILRSGILLPYVLSAYTYINYFWTFVWIFYNPEGDSHNPGLDFGLSAASTLGARSDYLCTDLCLFYEAFEALRLRFPESARVIYSLIGVLSNKEYGFRAIAIFS